MLALAPLPGQPGSFRRPARLRRRACASCRFAGLEGFQGLGALPWDLRDRRGQLRQNWHALRAQVNGTGTQPRTGFSSQLQKDVEYEYTRFLKWDDNLSLDRVIVEATGAYEPELIEYETVYRGLSKKAADELEAHDEKPNFRVPAPVFIPPAPGSSSETLRTVALAGGAAAALWLLWRVAR